MRRKVFFGRVAFVLMVLSLGLRSYGEELDINKLRHDLSAAEDITADKIDRYINAESSQVRYKSYAAIWDAAIAMPFDKKNQLIQYLAVGMNDKEQSIREATVRWLLGFREKEMSDSTKKILEKNLDKGELNKDRILLAGIYGSESVLSKIRKLGSTIVGEPEVGRWYGSKEWASNLVLARLGEIDAEKLVQRVESESNVVARVTICLQDITYIKRPKGVQLLLKYLNSEERLPSVRDNTLGEKVCLRAAFFLGQCIKGFPVVKEYYADYTEDDIASCRKWMSIQTEWIFK